MNKVSEAQKQRQAIVGEIQDAVVSFVETNFKGKPVDIAILGIISAAVKLVIIGTKNPSVPTACQTLLDTLTQIRDIEKQQEARIIVSK